MAPAIEMPPFVAVWSLVLALPVFCVGAFEFELLGFVVVSGDFVFFVAPWRLALATVVAVLAALAWTEKLAAVFPLEVAVMEEVVLSTRTATATPAPPTLDPLASATVVMDTSFVDDTEKAPVTWNEVVPDNVDVAREVTTVTAAAASCVPFASFQNVALVVGVLPLFVVLREM